ncbi:MAG: C39 family peptidase [Acutalibacter sp.]
MKKKHRGLLAAFLLAVLLLGGWGVLSWNKEPPVQPAAGPMSPSPAPSPSLEATPTPTPAVDPPAAQLVTVDGQEYLTGNGIPTVYFNQKDSQWANQPYGNDNIGVYGCGPVAMSMVVSTMTDTLMDPAAMAQWAADNGYWASGAGTYHSFIQGAAEAFGLQATACPRTSQDLEEALLAGNLLVALMGPGHFTDGGHFIVLRGTTLAGQITVADPNSRENSLVAWDPQTIFDELSTSTVYGAPLWVISPAE